MKKIQDNDLLNDKSISPCCDDECDTIKFTKEEIEAIYSEIDSDREQND